MGAAEHNSPPPKEPDSNERAFNTSTSIVRDYANRIEHNYARPALKFSRATFEERPALAIFFAIFSSLSLVPVVSFLGVCVFVIVSFTAIALGCACIAISAVLLALSAIIVSILLATLLVSLFLTAAVISSYMLFRLAVLVRQDGRSGISEWAGETKQHFLNNTTRGRQNDRKPVPDNGLSTKT